MQAYNPDNPVAGSVEIVGERQMREMTRERLKMWKRVNGRFPGNILYYRDGVSESQFDKVLTKEVRAISGAYQDETQTNNEVKITAVVGVKRHNVRLYPLQSNNQWASGTDNCLPGTVVDIGITHPYNFDFFLISHDGLQRTVKPTHYTVLINDMNFSAVDIQNLTHNLCYTYQRSTTSVSYAPPAYYADRLCERGRYYLMDWFDGRPSLETECATLTEDQIEQKRVGPRGGRADGNPWHANLNEKMFWM